MFCSTSSLTGSVGTGQRVAAACVPRGAKVQLEMGGKNPFVVFADADLDALQLSLLHDEDTPAGISLATGCEKPSDRFRVSPWAWAR